MWILWVYALYIQAMRLPITPHPLADNFEKCQRQISSLHMCISSIPYQVWHMFLAGVHTHTHTLTQYIYCQVKMQV